MKKFILLLLISQLLSYLLSADIILKQETFFNESFYLNDKHIEYSEIKELTKKNAYSQWKLQNYKTVNDTIPYLLLGGIALMTLNDNYIHNVGIGLSYTALLQLFSNNDKLSSAVDSYNNKFTEKEIMESYEINKIKKPKNNTGTFFNSLFAMTYGIIMLNNTAINPVVSGSAWFSLSIIDSLTSDNLQGMLYPTSLGLLFFANNLSEEKRNEIFMSTLVLGSFLYKGPYYSNPNEEKFIKEYNNQLNTTINSN
ncbi:MAG: hypothetical protein WCH76_01190 [Candidatus Riflemargulisbacteria bacterium]